MNGKDRLADLIAAPDRVAEIPQDQVPALMAQLAGLQAVLLSRLLVVHNGAGPSRVAPAEPDRLLTAEEAAPILGMTPRWLYRHARQLSFARRLSRKALRFSEAGLRRYMAARRP